jgi:hypothetical protein
MISLPCCHSDFESRFPDEREAALAVENSRMARHLSTHGTLDGYRPGREFPCLGILSVEDRRGPQWEVRCSACDFLTTIRSPERPRPERTMDEAKW